MRCIQILSLGLGTPPFDKIWFRVCLVKGRQIAECVGLHAMKEIKFCNPFFHFTLSDVAKGGRRRGRRPGCHHFGVTAFYDVNP